MEEVTCVSAYDQGETTLVEIVGRDDAGELHVATYEFRPVGRAGDHIEPCERLAERHRYPIREALTADGYRVSLPSSTA